MTAFRLSVNGLPVCAEVSRKSEEGVLIPVLRRMTRMQRSFGRRLIVFMAGTPAAGKSTLTCLMERFSRSDPSLTPVQAVGLDGFHYPNRYLETHTAVRNGRSVTLRSIKGAPETYDVEALAETLALADPVFPVYDRRIHESIPYAFPVTEDILIVEGNWLLLDEKPWSQLKCDLSIFLRPEDTEMSLQAAIERKIAGGFDPDQARAFVERSDRANIDHCLKHSRKADINIIRRTDGELEVMI